MLKIFKNKNQKYKNTKKLDFDILKQFEHISKKEEETYFNEITKEIQERSLKNEIFIKKQIINNNIIVIDKFINHKLII